MRTNFKFALMSAAALLSLGLASCSSNDEEAPVNPTFDGEAVKTTFTISLPGKAKTRMSYEKVQGAEDIASFRGMDNIVIIPFRNADKTDRGTRLGKNITLWYNTLTVPQAANNENAIPSGNLLAESNAVLYNDVTVPLLTSGFLFYGKAAETSSDKFVNGNLKAAGLDDTDEITARSFTPTPIVDSFDDTKGVALATYVSNIAAAAADPATYPGATWAACADPANHTVANQAWYNADLGDRYTAFTSLKPGASQYVQACVQDLYSAIFASTNPVAEAIKAAIVDGTNAKDENVDGVLEFQDVINGYPENNNSMPAGAVALTWSGATATAVASSTNNHMTVNTATVVYPASLWYFANSALKVSNTSEKPAYNGSNNWNTILGEYTDGASVAASTRSVAIVDPIQYAVGRLDTKVSRLNDATGKYYDRQGVEVNIANGFTFTGVLIGGQKAVDWKFEPNGTTEYTIYDKDINTSTNGSNTLSASADAGTNYTLALETEKNQKIRVALEFVNNGDDFYGVDGVVKKGCKFYMIAELDPTDGSTNAANQGNTGNKVFKQDYKTIANFSIATGDADADGDGWAENPAGFANAYVTIPDLRTPMLELGFSVDLKWQTGITFTHTF